MIAHNKVTFFPTEWIQSHFEVARKIKSQFLKTYSRFKESLEV